VIIGLTVTDGRSYYYTPVPNPCQGKTTWKKR
jgi:hypothetical protein